MTITSTLGSMGQLLPFAAATLIKATVLLALVSIAAHLLRRRSAALRHLLWTLAIAGIVALPVLSALSPFKLHLLTQSASGVISDRTATPSPSANPIPDAKSDESAAPNVVASDPSSGTTPGVARRIGWPTILLTVWLAGALVLLARFAMGLFIVSRLARRAAPVTDESWLTLADRAARTLSVRAPVDVRASEDIAMPFATGFLTPTIVLPSSFTEWNTEKREAVLMHEFAHISRGDLAMNTLSHVARALYWFHPLAWLAAYRLRVEGERACDDAVLRGGARPSDYAEHLLSIVRSVGATVPSAALAMARRSDFEGRLLAILEPGLPRGVLTRGRAAGMAALFLVAVMPLAAMSPTASAAALGESTESQEVVAEPQSKVEAAAAVTALIETLSDANATVRVAAVNSLGQLQDPRAIAALAKALREDTDARVREAAAWALGEIDDRRAVPPLLEALKTERVASVREKIVRALGEIDDPSAVAGITGVLKDPSVAVRRAAVWALGELEDPAAVASLATMVRDEDAEVRKHVAEALGNLDNPGGLDALMTLAKDSNAEVRSHAINGLGQLEDLRALGALVTALKDPNAEVRQHAADAIGQLDGVEKAPGALIDLLADADKDVRHNAAHTLGHIGDAAAVPALKKLTTDADTDVRRAAAESLAEIGGPEAITALMGMLKDQDPEIRKIVAEALGTRRNR